VQKMSGQYFNKITNSMQKLQGDFMLSYTGINQIQTYNKALTPQARFQDLYSKGTNNPVLAAKNNYKLLNKKPTEEPYKKNNTNSIINQYQNKKPEVYSTAKNTYQITANKYNI